MNTDQEAERIAREKVINDRIAELETHVGKVFLPNDKSKPWPVKVIKYAGIHIIGAQNVATYIFSIDCPGRFFANVSATDFLETHTPMSTSSAIANDLPH